MTKISKLRGFAPVPETMPFVNYLTNTEGEFSLQLAKQRLGLFHHIFPDKEKIWAKGARLIDNTLYNAKKEGVHGHTPYLGSIDPELNFVAQRILKAKKKFAPAADMYIGRKDLAKGLNPELQQISIAGPIEDFWSEYKRLNAGCVITVTGYDEYGYYFEREDFANQDCINKYQLMGKLNDMLPKNSHNGLYVFMPISDANNSNLTPQITASKVNDHLKYLNAIAGTTKISNTNIKDWLRNCVEHKNAFNQIPSLTPEDNIMMLRNNPTWSTKDNEFNSEQDRIGCELFCIILIIIISAKALGGLIQICKDKEPTAFQGLDDIALRAMDFAASGTDFQKTDTGGSSTGGSNTGGSSTGGSTLTEEALCNAKQGYVWNPTTKTCDKVKTSGGEWIEGIPNIVTGAVAVLGGSLLLSK